MTNQEKTNYAKKLNDVAKQFFKKEDIEKEMGTGIAYRCPMCGSDEIKFEMEDYARCMRCKEYFDLINGYLVHHTPISDSKKGKDAYRCPNCESEDMYFEDEHAFCNSCKTWFKIGETTGRLLSMEGYGDSKKGKDDIRKMYIVETDKNKHSNTYCERCLNIAKDIAMEKKHSMIVEEMLIDSNSSCYFCAYIKKNIDEEEEEEELTEEEEELTKEIMILEEKLKTLKSMKGKNEKKEKDPDKEELTEEEKKKKKEEEEEKDPEEEEEELTEEEKKKETGNEKETNIENEEEEELTEEEKKKKEEEEEKSEDINIPHIKNALNEVIRQMMVITNSDPDMDIFNMVWKDMETLKDMKLRY